MKVGIIANPQSGKDMRRIVSDAFTFNNFEKLNILKRIVRTALEFGEINFLIMPDSFRFGEYLKEEFGKAINTLQFKPVGENDTVKSAKLMEEANVCCIVVLGGDGTNRLASKGITDTPLIPVSTGTNNAFPKLYEGTTIGLTLAAIEKLGEIDNAFLSRQKKLEIVQNGRVKDIALVDIAITKDDFIGSKTVISPEKIKEVFVSFAEPGAIGISSIFAYYTPIGRNAPFWGACRTGKNGFAIRVPIMPGKTDIVKIKSIKKLTAKDSAPISFYPSVAALDGERTVYINDGSFSVRMNPNGPYVVNVEKILGEIPVRKFFVL